MLIVDPPMTVSKYRGRILMQLPDEYLRWFTQKGFAESELAQ